MKKIIIFFISIFITLFVSVDFVDAEITEINVKINGGTITKIPGWTDNVPGGTRNYIDIDAFCNKFSSICNTSHNENHISGISRSITDTTGKELYFIRMWFTDENKVGGWIYGRFIFQNAIYTRSIKLLDANFQWVGGNLYAPIRFFSLALGCSIQGMGNTVDINPDAYRNDLLQKNNYKLTLDKDTSMYSLGIIPSNSKEFNVSMSFADGEKFLRNTLLITQLDEQNNHTNKEVTYTRMNISTNYRCSKFTNSECPGGFIDANSKESFTVVFTDKTENMFPSWVRVNITYHADTN